MYKRRRAPTKERLNQVYGPENYYSYLNSKEFKESCFKYIADCIEEIGPNSSILEIGCGLCSLLGLLKNSHPYIGFDLSDVAVKNAKKIWEHREDTEIYVGDFETFLEYAPLSVDIVLSGNCLIHIKEELREHFVEKYIVDTDAKYFIVYELQSVDTGFMSRHKLVKKKNFYVDMPNLLEVKKKRKVEVYKV